MEENENKKPDETEGQEPEVNTPPDEKEEEKNKVAAFFAPRRNKIIVGVSAAALIALIIGLSVGLSKCGSGGGGSATSSSSSGASKTSDEGSSGSKGNEGSASSKDDSSSKITSDAFPSALKFDGDKFTITLTETNEVTTTVKNGTVVHLTQNSGSTSTQDAYYTVEGTGSEAKYYSYAKDSSGTWIKDEDNAGSSSYERYAKRDVNKDFFDDKLTYAGLTFDKTKGGYTTSYTTDDGVSVSGEFYFKNSRLTKAIKTKSGGSETYAFSDTAMDITLPTNAHTHTSSAPGTLDLNSDNANFKFTCADCGKTVSRQRRDADTIGSIFYGYYPQTHVSDTAIISKLENLTAESNGWYLLEGAYYAKAAPNEHYYGNKFDDGTNIIASTANTYHWFSVDPIEWDILSSGSGQYSLVSKLLLDTHTYSDAQSSDESPSNNYKNSEIRTWLNGEFLTKAFAKGDSYLSTVRVDNSAATTDTSYNPYDCDNTPDKVYLLSYQDYTNTAYFADAKARQCKTSDWARNNHAECDIEDNYAGTYWTRSPYSNSHNEVSYINGQDGGNMDSQDASKDYFSVRPAITVKLPAASDHRHTNPTSGSRDWNNGGTTFSGVCPDCGETVTREYNASTDTTTGFFYGYYPQTHVSDSTIITALDGKTPDTTTGWYELDGEYYAKATAANTTELNFDDKTAITKGDEYWFKCEPIEWKVLTSDSTKGTYSLYSSLLLDATQYNSETWADDDTSYDHRPCNYSCSSLRTWLNGEFLTKAFFKNSSKPETTTVDNSTASLQFQNLGLICDNTQDQVYALCYRDCGTKKWGGYFTSADERVGITTDYARASGVAISAADNSAKYWTRSPTATTKASVVDETGYYSNDDVVTATYCVRPAITIKIS